MVPAWLQIVQTVATVVLLCALALPNFYFHATTAYGILRDGLEDAVVSVAAVTRGMRAGTAALGLGDKSDNSDNGRENGDIHTRTYERPAQPRIRGQRSEA